MLIMKYFILVSFLLWGCKKPNNILEVAPKEFEYFKVSGTIVDCNGNPVLNGRVFINYKINGSFYTKVENGKFSIEINNYDDNPTYTLIGINNTTQLQSIAQKIVLTNEFMNLGEIKCCNNNTQEFVNVQTSSSTFNWSSSNLNDSIVTNTYHTVPNSNNIWQMQTAIMATKPYTGISSENFTKLWINHNNSTGSVYLAGFNVSHFLLNPSLAIVYERDSSTTCVITEMGEKNEGFISGTVTNAKCFYGSGITRNFNGTFRVRRIVEN